MLREKVENDKSWLELKHIDAYLNERKIISDLSICLKYNDNTVILGPNGSGKSTLLRLINRSIYPVVKPNSSIKILDSELINIWNLRKHIGFVISELSTRINQDIKIVDIISSGLNGTFRRTDNIGKSQQENICKIIETIGFKGMENLTFKELSDGQKRIAIIGRSLINNPDILVLDEPFINLDLKSYIILQNILNNICMQGKSILYVTHSVESIIANANRILFMKDGTIIGDGTPKDMITSNNISSLYDVEIEIYKHKDCWSSRAIGNHQQ